MLFTERGRGLREEKASRPALPHVWMWTGVTQQDMAQTEAPARRDGSPRRKLDAGRGAPPCTPEQPAGLCRAEKHRSPPCERQLAPSCAGSLPGTPTATHPVRFCRSGGTQVGHGHQHVALGTCQGTGRLPSRGAEGAEHRTEKKLKPAFSLNKPPYSSKQIFL